MSAVSIYGVDPTAVADLPEEVSLDVSQRGTPWRGQEKATILVVEDDRPVNELLALRFRKAGYRVLQSFEGETGIALFAQFSPDLVILDLMLPTIDGWEVVRQLRQLSLVPIVMLTARNQERDEVRGLSLGADDYVTKPFNFAKLLARVEALLRRSSLGSIENNRMMYQDPVITIDLWRRQVSVRGHAIDLSPTEYRLLLTLVRYYGQVLSHEQLLLEVWGPNYDSVASVKAYVSYLRRKIERHPDDPELIHTCWGIGYRYEVLDHTSADGAGAGGK